MYRKSMFYLNIVDILSKNSSLGKVTRLDWQEHLLNIPCGGAIMTKVGIFWIVVSGWFLSLSGFAQEAGWIDNFDGQSEHYLLKRQDETLPVTLLTVLKVGDQISVNDEQHLIELNLQGGTHSVKVTHENSPFLINLEQQVPANLDGLWKWTKQRLNEWQQLTQAESAKTDPKLVAPTIPLLENMKQSAILVAGKRPLYLQWYGGTPPYRVQIKKRHDELLTVISAETAIKTEDLNFEADNAYRVEITDANDKVFIGGFRVVALENLPNDSKTLPTDNLSDVVRQTLQATWLAQQEQQKWIFEAYQQAAKLANQYLPAQLLQQALARGEEKQTKRGIRG